MDCWRSSCLPIYCRWCVQFLGTEPALCAQFGRQGVYFRSEITHNCSFTWVRVGSLASATGRSPAQCALRFRSLSRVSNSPDEAVNDEEQSVRGLAHQAFPIVTEPNGLTCSGLVTRPAPKKASCSAGRSSSRCHTANSRSRRCSSDSGDSNWERL